MPYDPRWFEIPWKWPLSLTALILLTGCTTRYRPPVNTKTVIEAPVYYQPLTRPVSRLSPSAVGGCAAPVQAQAPTQAPTQAVPMGRPAVPMGVTAVPMGVTAVPMGRQAPAPRMRRAAPPVRQTTQRTTSVTRPVQGLSCVPRAVSLGRPAVPTGRQTLSRRGSGPIRGAARQPGVVTNGGSSADFVFGKRGAVMPIPCPPSIELLWPGTAVCPAGKRCVGGT